MDSPPPDLLSWTFWFKDSASVRDLLVSLGAVIGLPLLIWREITGHRTVNIAAERHLKHTEADRERRITDSFTKAVELLGKPELEVRLGAIYALERIARESKHDHWPIMETLTAYVRTRSPYQIKQQDDFKSNQSHVPDEAVQGTVQASLTEIAVDVQAVLTVLTRRSSKHEEKNHRINLSRADLFKASLTGADLSGANLIDTNLSRADLSKVRLTGADLSGANLIDTNLIEAHLSGADLSKADLFGADLSKADLSKADLIGVHLSKARLSGANLSGASLYGTNLSRADLSETDLSGTNLIGVDLSEARLTRADLSKARLTGADLTGAYLIDTNLTGVKFCNTTMPDGTINDRDCLSE